MGILLLQAKGQPRDLTSAESAFYMNLTLWKKCNLSAKYNAHVIFDHLYIHS